MASFDPCSNCVKEGSLLNILISVDEDIGLKREKGVAPSHSVGSWNWKGWALWFSVLSGSAHGFSSLLGEV